MSKRVLGYANWLRGRRDFHRREVVDLMIADLNAHAPDHTVVTGDLVNLSLEEEFPAARQWLETIGSPPRVTVVPGNHDAYVKVPWSKSLALWQDYMQSDADGASFVKSNEPFPFVRRLGSVAVVGLSSAVPMPPLIAGGKLGDVQLRSLANILKRLGESGLFRIVLIHHPPLPGQNITRKALFDSAEMRNVLAGEGAELVLHGHNHRDMLTMIDTPHGTANVIGVPSASAAINGHRPAAQYNLYHVSGTAGAWQCEVEIRGYDPAAATFGPVRSFSLDTGQTA